MSKYKDYVMSIHSSKAVMVDEIQSTTSKYKNAYADAVMQLALTKGKREEVTSVVIVFQSFLCLFQAQSEIIAQELPMLISEYGFIFKVYIVAAVFISVRYKKTVP